MPPKDGCSAEAAGERSLTGPAPPRRLARIVRRRPFDPVASIVRQVDAALRRHYGIREFTDDPLCILRLSRERAWRGLLLSDGTPIAAGAPVGELHFWSEHMPAFARDGPDLGWAVETSRRLRRSFILLADAVAGDPNWQNLRAVFARWAFAGAFDATHQRRLIEEFGLDIFAPDRTIAHRIHDLMQDFLLWGMLRAFNPGALHSHGFFRSRQELWISRPALLARFAAAPRSAPGPHLAPAPERRIDQTPEPAEARRCA
ncbi:MAG TPA: hypothetical protein VMF62_12885 [Acetobacteraceae bacterium]|nr:hypothetical protein [Acetobacteraceae bacterium]